jgi:hypothetical protein
MTETDLLLSLLKRQYSADLALYNMPHDCEQDQHEAALKEHDEIHAEIGRFFSKFGIVL